MRDDHHDEPHQQHGDGGVHVPVALSLSKMLGVGFKPFAIIIMIAASCAFINPAGFQTNLMVQKDGGYGFMDFAKVGIPLTVIQAVVVLALSPIVYGF